MATHDSTIRTLRTPEEIDAQEATNAALFPPISTHAQNLLEIADALYHALLTGGIAADLDREATGRYEAGEAALSSDNPYTRRVAYLQLLQAFYEQPHAVEKALGRLYHQLEEVCFTPPAAPDLPFSDWPDFEQTADAVLHARPLRPDIVLVSPDVAGSAAWLMVTPVLVEVDTYLYIGASADRLYRVVHRATDGQGRALLTTADDELWIVGADDVPPVCRAA